MSQGGTPRNAGTAKKEKKEGSAPPGQFVSDSTATNSRQLLNAYIYDFLVKSGLPATAKAFVAEADVPTTNTVAPGAAEPARADLPALQISMDAPQGFLYEWWQIFWDVFNARTHRAGSGPAQQYFQLQLLRQRREHALHSMTAHAAHAQAQGQPQLQIQSQAAPQAMQTPVAKASVPPAPTGSPAKRQRISNNSTPTSVPSASPLTGHPPPPQMVMQSFNPQYMYKGPGSATTPGIPFNPMELQPQMKVPMGVYAGQNGAMMNGMAQNGAIMAQNGQGLTMGATNGATNGTNGAGFTSMNANLQEYQTQLMLMERQNRMMMEHDHAGGDAMAGQQTMAIPNQRWQQLLQLQMPPPQNAARNTPAASPATASAPHPVDSNGHTPSNVKTPVVANMPTPNNSGGAGPGTGSTGKKKPAPKRQRKMSKTNGSEPPTPTTPLTPANVQTTPQLANQQPPPAASAVTTTGPKKSVSAPASKRKSSTSDAPTHIDPNALRSPATNVKQAKETAEEVKPRETAILPETGHELIGVAPEQEEGLATNFMQDSQFLTDFGKVHGVAVAPEDMDFDFNNFLNTGENEHMGSNVGFEGVFGWADGV
ncbi:hypothetical protein BABINDRAFT_168381 [Babjeviella inositovora NRRL Y-12698]|uniref:Uncharacterized protein n=1 Tax=Babjeviella inositovora NRRL Y-12698 TaxID=984486 RepID=A0A1E3QKL1_9ASCO|nr:uncharacterized protein BABINDRAFT_168381 [Babjeviella inositovora NRRL Y-12698]ODQ78190.1 hypothetical protein BABINDRAFT_168381 [Babjeviella inositovora NRRL Y-12698]